jgi:hypothetical protein
MVPKGFAIRVKKLRIRLLQRPLALPTVILADVNLIPRRVDLKNKLFPRRRLNLLRNSLCVHGSCIPSFNSTPQLRSTIYPNSSQQIIQSSERTNPRLRENSPPAPHPLGTPISRLARQSSISSQSIAQISQSSQATFTQSQRLSLTSQPNACESQTISNSAAESAELSPFRRAPHLCKNTPA